MVTRAKSFVFFLTLSFSSILSGCLWGERAPPTQIAHLDSSENGCKAFLKVFASSENESQEVLNCWSNEAEKLWDHVKGEKPDTLSEEELTTLIRKKIVLLPGGVEKNLSKVHAVFTLLDSHKKITHTQTNGLISWLRENRENLREFYSTLQTNPFLFRYSLLVKTFAAARGGLDLISSSISSEVLSENLLSLLEISDPDINRAFLPLIKTTLNTLGMLCPSIQNIGVWNTNELSSCLALLPSQFAVAAPWLEFRLNEIKTVPDSTQIKAVQASLEKTQKAVTAWFNQSGLHSFSTQLILDLVESLGAKPPKNLIESLKIIRRFNPQSTEESLHPTVIPKLFEILKNYQIKELGGIPSYVDTLQKHLCSNTSALSWTDCVPPETELIENPSEILALARQIKNPKYGGEAAPLSGSRFQKISLFDATAEQVITAFDTDHDGLIRSEGQNSSDEVVALITIGLNTVDIFERFFHNVQRKLHGLSVEETFPRISLSQYDLKGIARLLTLFGTDILVQRTEEEKRHLETIISGLLGYLVGPAQKNSLFLDQKAITAIFNFVDSLGDYQKNFLTLIQPRGESETDTIPRNTLLKTLPTFIEHNFPRTYKSCLAFGFQNSCQTVYERLLPLGHQVHLYDLDLVTLFASAMEGLLDHCDRNQDEKLSLNFLNSNDELACTTRKYSDIALHLIDAEIIPHEGTEQIQSILKFANLNGLTQTCVKVPLITGKIDDMYLSPLELPFTRGYATLGSMYGLTANVLLKNGF